MIAYVTFGVDCIQHAERSYSACQSSGILEQMAA